MPPKRLPTIPHPDQPPFPAAIAATAGFLAKEVASLFRGSFESVMRRHALNPRQYLILQVLREQGVLSQQAVGQQTGMDRTSTMQAAMGLAEAGLVDRQDDPADRRVYRLTLTEAGASLIDVLDSQLREAEARILAPLDAQSQADFLRQMRTLLSSGGGTCGGSGTMGETSR
jgi:MarR family transcriptional regulator, lower aerobic nicotinate degradation pathway regulator